MALIVCPDCDRSVSDAAGACIYCGRPLSRRTSQPPTEQSPVSASTAESAHGAHASPSVSPSGLRPYFPVATHKFVVLSLCTLTLYELYWCYHNWKRIRDRHHEDVSPFWRAFFAPLWCFSLFRRIRGDAKDAGIAVDWSPNPLAVLFLVLTITWRLPDPWWLLSIGSFVAMIPVVQTIDDLNRLSSAPETLNSSYSAANVITIIVGGLLLLLAVVGTFLPEA